MSQIRLLLKGRKAIFPIFKIKKIAIMTMMFSLKIKEKEIADMFSSKRHSQEWESSMSTQVLEAVIVVIAAVEKYSKEEVTTTK